MKSNTLFIESLEARVAPALLVNGGNLLGGTGNPTTGETSTGGNTVTLVKVLSGQALVFYNNGEITGISVGKHTKLDITGDIVGDIVTNLDSNGRLTDSDHNPANGEDGGILLPIGIKGITTHPLSDEKGSVGRIIAGGQISNVNISGEIAGLYAGNGVFRNGSPVTISTGQIDVNTVQPGLQNTYNLDEGSSSFNGNANIKNVTIDTARQLEIFAGSGIGTDGSGVGSQGSSITNVTIAKTLSAEGAKPVVFLHAGDGAEGSTNGGLGGSITSFNDQGSTSYVKLQTGDGGVADAGTGGAGGSLLSSTIVSSSTRYDLVMGHGGNGVAGGVGGGIQALSFTDNVDGGKSLIATDDFNKDGLPDVVLVNTLTGEATVSLGTTTTANTGEANFAVALQTVTQANGTKVQTPFLPAQGANPTSLVVTDLNGDGLPDFVVSYASTNSLGEFLNTGNGMFSPTRVDLHGISPTRIVAGDFTGSGHMDIAVVSAADTTNSRSGLSSDIYLVANDGAGHLTVNTTSVDTLPGTATDAAGTGTELFVGFKDGTITPVFFQGGVGAVESSIVAFGGKGVPVNSLDATTNLGTIFIAAYSKDINALQEAAGNTTLSATAEVDRFTFDNATGRATTTLTFVPDTSVTKVHFLADSTLIGAVSPGALTIYALDSTGHYSTLSTLGSDGNLQDFATTDMNGVFQIAASGAANNRFFFTAGNPASDVGVPAFQFSETPFEPRAITFTTGDGGNGTSLAGGTAGSIKGLTFTQALGAGVLQAGGSYNTILSTGQGGDSDGDVGGKGGGIRNANLTLAPAHLSYSDDTTMATFLTGEGGNGATGGGGGSMKKIAVTAGQEEAVSGGINIDSAAVSMTAGNGGVGSVDAGGVGGSILLAGQSALSGLSYVDEDSTTPNTPALLVKAGDGGAGVTAGGDGGSLTNVGSQNTSSQGGADVKVTELSDALLTSGTGGAASNGNGGAGGNITGSNVTVSQASHGVTINNVAYHQSVVGDFNDGLTIGTNGWVAVVAGKGGVGTGGIGGAGGSVNKSTVGSSNGSLLTSFGGTSGTKLPFALAGDAVEALDTLQHPDTPDHPNNSTPETFSTGNLYGVFVKSGTGGDGSAGGGAGGSLQRLTLNSPADSRIYAGVVAAGNGGNALDAGVGGAGGSIQGITQTKDVNSAINLIQAGNGGLGAGDVGGTGGSIQGVNTEGFIGIPSTNSAGGGHYLGVFNTIAGVSSDITSVLPNASQLPQGIFAGQGADGAANGSIEKIVARQIAAIGATVQANGHFAAASSVDNVTADLIGYQPDTSTAPVSPGSNVPVDGFILASVVSNINTLDPNRTASLTFNS